MALPMGKNGGISYIPFFGGYLPCSSLSDRKVLDGQLVHQQHGLNLFVLKARKSLNYWIVEAEYAALIGVG